MKQKSNIMKNFLFILMFVAGAVKGQELRLPMLINGNANLHPQKQNYDTIKTTLLISRCDTCATFSVKGFAVRQQYSYYGSPDSDATGTTLAINVKHTAYNIIKYLDKNKKPFPSTTIIWQSK